MLQIEILAIGNEILLGDVQDTNSHYLCRLFTGRGARVRRVAQVRDEVEAIAQELREALQRGTDLLMITGGLGPTDDDLTLRAIAEGLGRPLQEDAAAIALLEKRYQDLAEQGWLGDTRLTPPRRKMAFLPAGGEALPNPVGTAPGVLLREGGCAIVCLPGVPDEMRGIVEGPLARVLDGMLGPGTYDEWTVIVQAGEAMLAPHLRQVAAAHPEVYIKSHAQRLPRSQGPLRVRVTLSLAGRSAEEVQAGLERALHMLQTTLAAAGIVVEEGAGKAETAEPSSHLLAQR
jgi:molybdenum cofactor synthesis domain-containing protein